MEIVTRKISELRPSENNVRRHNANQIKELVKAIDAFGVIRPIIIDENNVIMCGHGLYEALSSKGVETVDCKVVSGLSEKQKKKLMLADNKIYDLGTSDYDIIDQILTELGQEGDFEIPGYDSDSLEEMYGIRSLESASPAAVTSGMGEYSPMAEIAPQSQTEPTNEPEPSRRVQEERAQAMMRRIVVCPHCGETIEL